MWSIEQVTKLGNAKLKSKCVKSYHIEKQIKQYFIDESNSNNGTIHSDDSAPNRETDTTAIEKDYLGDGMDSIVKSVCERREKESNDSENDSDYSDNE